MFSTSKVKRRQKFVWGLPEGVDFLGVSSSFPDISKKKNALKIHIWELQTFIDSSNILHED
jgi:hypothetical protein